MQQDPPGSIGNTHPNPEGILEKVAAGGKLQVVLGERGLAERVVNLL